MSTASTTALVLNGQQQQILNQAQQLVGSNPMTAGEWYQISGNPYATVSRAAEVHEPAALHLGGGQQQHAASQARLEHPAGDARRARLQPAHDGQLGTVTLNPTGTSDTNLPTFVDVALRRRVGARSR